MPFCKRAQNTALLRPFVALLLFSKKSRSKNPLLQKGKSRHVRGGFGPFYKRAKVGGQCFGPFYKRAFF